MAMKLKVKTGGASKPATRTKASKPAAKRTPAKKATSKPAAKRSAARKPAATKAAPTRTNRSPKVPEGKERQIEAMRKKLKKQGDLRLKLHEQHKEAVAELAEMVEDCLSKGMPMGMVHENAQISRQWIYKINSHSGRSDAPKSKPAAKKTSTARKPAAKATTAKRTVAKKSGAKKLKIRA